ncbi:hypothetical protein CDD81_1887 [Ophiocordyceps australis]|uniref:Uncharacterized protein n=1 Tax=Ophiocordyceps australis TaxID=1399860 RepID=A0A2C5XV13_9HYPO|nr:hypothetical protein CDD81_1887 [Ophiocordyceps australis]
MAQHREFPPIRACIFDMDGLLIDTEDLYTLCINKVLERHGRPPMPWSVKAKLQGRPGPAATQIFQEWAQLPISHEQYMAELTELQRKHFPSAQPLPGVAPLLAHLQPRVHLALATSSHAANFALKTAHLADLFSLFPANCCVLGDDARVPRGRGKPLPDIFLLALQAINDSRPPDEPPIRPEECLVLEDSVPGVEAGRRAGMRVVWCPHPKLKEEYAGREDAVLAGRTGEAGNVDMHQLGEPGDGWAQHMATLEAFPYADYGIEVAPSHACQ